MPVVRDIARERFKSASLFPNPALAYAEPYEFTDLETYIPQEVLEVSQGSGLPLGLKDLGPGEAVLEIGCGAGIHCFEAARLAGSEGRVVGVELADDLFSIARRNGSRVAKNLSFPGSAIDFKKGTAEDLPLEHEQFDLVLYNYQLGMARNKTAVFEEIFRVLRPGGRFSVSDIVSDTAVPQYIKTNECKWGFSLAGALDIEQYLKIIRKAGFFSVEQLKFGFWKNIDGINFYSTNVRGFKLDRVAMDKTEPARYAIFRGPFNKVKDEYGNAYQRGQSKKISKEVFEILNLPGYRPHFILANEAVDSISIESQLVVVKSEQEKDVWEGDYALLTSLFLMGEDDDRHTFYAGQPVEISERTKLNFANKSYSKFFTILNRTSDTGE
ncbi:MAG: methyltransferase domain-containing protein [Candidatus Omnitrophica bacterium]|nr:methyltransferase domain-containing protein [Candidatus Omnitrophota bacterium]